jgi:hypothetical protein
VKHTEHSNKELQLALCDIRERGADRSKEQVIENPRCVQSEHVEFFWHSEDHVKVRNWQQLTRTRLQPFAPRGRLASRAGSIPTRMPLNVFVTAVITLLPLPAKSGRTACADRAQRFPLHGSGAMSTTIALATRSHDRAEVRLGVHGSPWL